MNIQDLGAIGEFVSSVAIVITLIFLTIETRQARNATQQSNRQARHRIRTDLSLAIALNPQLTEITAKMMEPADPSPIVPDPTIFNLSLAEGIQVYNYYLAFVRHLEDQFFSDLPVTDRFALESQVRAIKSTSYGMEFWRVSRPIFDRGFQDYFDSLQLEDDPRLAR